MIPRGRDVVVVGLGGMGAAALYHLARRGRAPLGLERFKVLHGHGSSHGESRILRLAYFEDPAYVPLARRSLELWRTLERESGERLFRRTGSLDGGPEDGALFAGSLRSCLEHGLDHEVLDGKVLGRRFPGFRFPPESRFVLQADGGSLRPERCTLSHLRMAEALGAEVAEAVRVRGWEARGDGVRLEVEAGGEVGTVDAGALVLTPGPWASELVPGLAPALRVERQVVGWTEPPDPARFDPDRFPVFNVEVDEGHHYGLPALGGLGPKVGRFGHRGETVEPDRSSREAGPEDREVLDRFASRYLVDAGPLGATRTCLFTHTPDEHFVVDRLSGDPPVVLGCGFSGHGFKFASALGEMMADLVDDPDPGSRPSLFSRRRAALAAAGAPPI